MRLLSITRAISISSVLVFSLSANAALIDFTDTSWRDAINASDGQSATIGNVTITAGGFNHHDAYDLSFNGSTSERSGCQAGQPNNGLTCDGDGIGLGRDDEISQSGSQFNHHDESLTISFDQAVDVTNLFVLDLFGSERSGEVAIINGESYQAPVGNLGFAGGFYATGFNELGVTSIFLQGNADYFSDYALAAIEYSLSPISVSTVPLPGALVLFASALFGLFGVKRFS